MNDTTLLEAVLRRDIAVCRLLLEHGAEVNARDKDGRLPLYEAVKRVTDEAASRVTVKRFPKICKLLLEHGAEVNAVV